MTAQLASLDRADEVAAQRLADGQIAWDETTPSDRMLALIRLEAKEPTWGAGRLAERLGCTPRTVCRIRARLRAAQ